MLVQRWIVEPLSLVPKQTESHEPIYSNPKSFSITGSQALGLGNPCPEALPRLRKWRQSLRICVTRQSLVTSSPTNHLGLL